jgi:hypothetical protein
VTIVGCDFDLGWKQIAVFDVETGEVTERKLGHGDVEAEHKQAAQQLRLEQARDAHGGKPRGGLLPLD